MRLRSLSIVLVVWLLGCLSGSSTTSPQPIGEGTRVLFIGNSLTYVNDVPGILQALADSAGGEKLAVASRALPNYALIDHWAEGVVQGTIEKGGWGWVVMQQGWTPAGIYRDTLRLAAKNFAPAIAKAGAKAAMYQTWPTSDRQGQFQASIESYELAASDIGGVVFPVARAWLAVWARNSTIELYSDGLHANVAGSYLAALVMYAKMFDKTPVGLPATVRTRTGAVVRIDPAIARTLQEAAAEVVGGR